MNRLWIVTVIAFLILSACSPSAPSVEVKSLVVTKGDTFQFRTNTTGGWISLTCKSVNPPVFIGRAFDISGGSGQWTVYESGSTMIFFFVESVPGSKIRVYDTDEGAGWFKK